MIEQRVLNLFEDKLVLGANLTPEEYNLFLTSLLTYLDHSKQKDVVQGRTYEYLSSKLDEFIRLFILIGFNPRELVYIFTRMPSVLNIIDTCYLKFLLLGVIEDETMQVRKSRILAYPLDLQVGLQVIYARYSLIRISKYNTFNWSNLVHSSQNKFCKMFVKARVSKPYQIFTTLEETKEWLSQVDVTAIDWNEIKSWDVNKEFVAKYEETKRTI